MTLSAELFTFSPVQEPPLAFYGLLIAIILGLVGAGFRVVGNMHSRDEVRISNACFLLAAVVAGGTVFMWGVTTPQSLTVRLIVCVVLFGLFGWLSVEAVRYVGRQYKIKVQDKAASESAQAQPQSTTPANGATPLPAITPMPATSPSPGIMPTGANVNTQPTPGTSEQPKPKLEIHFENKPALHHTRLSRDVRHNPP